MLKKSGFLVGVVLAFVFLFGFVCANPALELDTDGYYKIHNCTELQNISLNLSANYKLVNDIDCPDTINWNSGKGFRPIGSGLWQNRFTGDFDGKGFAISNLYINRTGEDRVGLFSQINDGSLLSNINLTNVSVVGRGYVGGLVGHLGDSGSISNSSSEGSVSGNYAGSLVGYSAGQISDSYSTGSVTSSGNYAGGLVGQSSGSISSSYFTGSVTSSGKHVGGLVGHLGDSGSISNSFSEGSVSGSSSVGGLVGYSVGQISDSYSIGNVTGYHRIGGLVGYLYGGKVINSYYNYNTTYINGENVISIGAIYSDEFNLWISQNKFLDIDNYLTNKEGEYYLINSVSDFKQLLFFGQDESLKFKLNSNLSLENEKDFFIPYLAGEFDGSNNTISKLNVNEPSVSHVGLFGYSFGNLSNVYLVDISVIGDEDVGGVVGRCHNSTIYNSYVTGSVEGGNVGGLVGYTEHLTVRDSYSNVTVIGFSGYAGGLIGYGLYNFINNVSAFGTVSGSNCVGGLIGCSYDSTLSNSYAMGNVVGGSQVGGLVGEFEAGLISNSYSIGNVVATGWAIGGFVGYAYDNLVISNSYSIGNVTGDESVGGFVGYFDEGSIDNSYSIGEVTGNVEIGGFVGEEGGNTAIHDSYYNKDTSGQSDTGKGEPKTTAEMKTQSTYINWDFNSVWGIDGGLNRGYPFLSWQTVFISSEEVQEEDDSSTRSGRGYSGPVSSHVSEASLQNGYTRNLRKIDSLWFNHNGEKHFITIDEIEDDSIDITVQSEPQKFNIKLGESVNVDLNDDGVYDVEITYVEYLRALASLKVRAISEEYEELKTESDTNIENDENIFGKEVVAKSNKWIWWIVTVILIVLSIILIREKYSIKKKVPRRKK